MNKNNFLDELKRRNVYKVAIAYGITAWLLAQVASLAAHTFEAPSWIMKMIIIALIIGFPIALLLAWAYEMTPEGIIKTDDLDTEVNGEDKRIITRPRINNLVIGILLIIVVGQFIYSRSFVTEASESIEVMPNQDHSIAVLPLLNLNSNDENLEYFSDGVTQEIIDELSQIRALTMIAFTTTIRYKKTDKLNKDIAGELNAKYLISGTSRIFNDGDSVRISLELIDTKDNDKRIWSDTYNEVMDDAPNIQIKIARQVAKSLDVEMTTAEKSKIDEVNTTSGEAYRLFLLARSEFFKLSKEGFRRSIETLEKVIEIDPDYAQAHTFLAWAYSLTSNPWFDGHINKPIKELNEYVNPLIERSLFLDPSNSDIFLVRGHQKAFMDGALRDAKKDVDFALDLNSWPMVPTTYCMCIVVSTYVALDDIEPAADMIEMARKLDPGSVFIEWDAANVLMKKGKYQEAQLLYSNAAVTAPVSMFKTFLGWNLYHTGQYEKSKEQLLKTYRESELPITLNVAYLSNTYFQLGDVKNADKYLQELITRDASGEHHVNLYIAAVYLARGDKDKALDYLEKALDQKNWGMALFVNLDPLFKQLYDEPRFVKIRRTIQYY